MSSSSVLNATDILTDGLHGNKNGRVRGLSCHTEAKEDATDYMKDLEKIRNWRKEGDFTTPRHCPRLQKMTFQYKKMLNKYIRCKLSAGKEQRKFIKQRPEKLIKQRPENLSSNEEKN